MTISGESHLSSGSDLDRLEEELAWVSLRLKAIVERSRLRRAVGPPAEYRGLYVTDEEVDELLSQQSGDLTVEHLVAEAVALRQSLDERHLEGDSSAALTRVVEAFGLGPMERIVLIVALAPYLDPGYEKVYAYANDDIMKRWPTVILTLEVLSDGKNGRFALRPLFFQDSPLVRHDLIVVGDTASPNVALPDRQVSLDPHVAEVLLGYNGLDPRLHGVARCVEPTDENRKVGEALAEAMCWRVDSRVYIGGRWRAEKMEALAQACASLGLKLVSLDMAALSSAAEPARLLALALRDARLHNAAILIEGYGGQDTEAEVATYAVELASRLQDHPLPVVFSDRASTPARLPVDLHLQLDFPAPNFEARQQSWRSAGHLDEDQAFQLAAMYRLGKQEVRSAVEMARSIAHLEGRQQITLD